MEEQEEKQEIEKQEAVKQEIPKGYYSTQVPTQFANIIALGDKQVPTDELIVKMANAIDKAGLFK